MLLFVCEAVRRTCWLTVVQMCSSNKRFKPLGNDGTWAFDCQHPDLVAACAHSDFCEGRANGLYANPSSAECSSEHLACSGSAHPADAFCGDDEVFDATSRSCIAIAQSACAPAEPTGWCAGKSESGAWPDPNVADPDCAGDQWVCNWSGATDAVVQSCNPGTVVAFDSPIPTWNRRCVSLPAKCLA